ncbi:MAG: hypothetical protein PHE09_01220 [Oscillospiraceae bacterium]|nr:hypothetical protein [Oscillospiraceae bacterium]
MKRTLPLLVGILFFVVLFAGCGDNHTPAQGESEPSAMISDANTSAQSGEDSDGDGSVTVQTSDANLTLNDAAELKDAKAIDIANTIITKGGSAELISNIRDTTILASDMEKGFYLTVTVIDWAGEPNEMYVVFRVDDFHYDIDNALRATVKEYDSMILPLGSNIYESSFLLANDWDSFSEECKRAVSYPFTATSEPGIDMSDVTKHTLQGNFGVCGAEEYCFFLKEPYTFIDDSSGAEVTIESVSFYPASWEAYTYEGYNIRALGEAQAQGYSITGVLKNYRGAGVYYWEELSIVPSDSESQIYSAKVCPQCGSALEWLGGAWICDSCSAAY